VALERPHQPREFAFIEDNPRLLVLVVRLLCVFDRISREELLLYRRLEADRRGCEGFDVEALGMHFHATVGRFPDGRLAEIFLDASKAGSAADATARDAAITASIAMQFGADIETIRKALCRDARGKAVGPLGVALDLIAQEGTP